MDLERPRNRLALLDWLPKNAVVAEIGVAYGEFAEEILKRTQPRRLHLIDLWAYQHPAIFTDSVNAAFCSDARHELHLKLVREKFATPIAREQVQVHQGYSDQQLLSFPDAYFDWIYIDANHAYDTVMADLIAAHRKIKSGGLICGHDYVEDSRETLFPYGVIQAVTEFCKEYRFRMVSLTTEEGEPTFYPSYALTRA